MASMAMETPKSDTFLPPIEKPRGLMLKLAYFFTRKQFGKVLTPLKVHSARLPIGFGQFYAKIGQLDKKLQVPPETIMLIREQVARSNVCLFCIDIGRAFTIKASMNQAKFDALEQYRSSPLFTDAERAAFAAFGMQARKGYAAEQGQAPQTIGYALTDTPAGLAAWMLDHDTDAYYKIARSFVDGQQPSGNLTREHIVDNITLYWLTSSGASSARSYWEEGQETVRAAGKDPSPVTVPVGFTTFPGEIWRTPRSWVEKAYPNVDIYFNEVDKGGHFAAWEEPELFASEVRATFRSLR